MVSARALLVLTLLGSAGAAGAADEAPRSAEPARLAARALLTAVAAVGGQLVAVGDRGVIVISHDRGASWEQAELVPTQALLTGVCFFDPMHGIAVGHDLVALITADGGRTWRRTHFAPQAQRPLLDVWCGEGGHAIAVGAYSTYLVSADAGATWQEEEFRPAPAPLPRGAVAGRGADEAGGGYHLNRIVAADGARLYIAGEAGHLYRSDDRGASWRGPSDQLCGTASRSARGSHRALDAECKCDRHCQRPAVGDPASSHGEIHRGSVHVSWRHSNAGGEA